MNKSARAKVMERAQGKCEACGKWAGEALHFDHFFGRTKAPETVENGWALDPICDHAKTVNYPDRVTWLERFISHCRKHGYEEAAARAIVAHHTASTKALFQSQQRFSKRGAP